jgi:hypothetical protein
MRRVYGLRIANVWALHGYGGAIRSGQSDCGVLVGGMVALGLKAGQEGEALGLTPPQATEWAGSLVKEYYDRFIAAFGTIKCRALTGVHFSVDEDVQRYYRDRALQEACLRRADEAIAILCELGEREGPPPGAH